MNTQKSIPDPLGLYTVAHGKNESKDYIRGAADQFLLDEKKVKELIQSERDRAKEEKREIKSYAESMMLQIEENAPKNNVGTQKKLYYNKALRRLINEKLTNAQDNYYETNTK